MSSPTMINFEVVLNERKAVVTGQIVKAQLILTLRHALDIHTIQLLVGGEIITRTIAFPGERDLVQTDKNFVLSANTTLFVSKNSTTRFEAAKYSYEFEFPIPEGSPTSVLGPNLRKNSVTLPIFSVEYWIEPWVAFTIHKGRKKTDKTLRTRLPFRVCDSADSYLASKWVNRPANKAIVTTVAKDMKMGDIGVVVHIPKVCVLAGEILPLNISIENDCDLKISKIKLSIYIVFDYGLNCLKIHGEDKVIKKLINKEIKPHQKDTIDTSMAIPKQFGNCPSTPETVGVKRKIQISYKLGVKIMTKGMVYDHTVSECSTPIVISNLRIL